MRKLSRIAKLVGSTEHIDFQDENKFQKPVTEFFEKFDEEIMGGGRIDTATLTKLIKNATGDGSADSGINVDVKLNTEPGFFAIELPVIDPNMPLLNNDWRELYDTGKEVDAIKALGGEAESFFDLKRCVVKGYFANPKFKFKLHLSVAHSDNGNADDYFTPAEKAAIVGHEVGHALTFIMFLSRTVVANTIISAAVTALNKTRVPTERIKLVVATEEALKVKFEDVNKLASTNSDEAFTVVVVNRVIETPWAVNGSDVYGYRYAEQLADQFSIRFGGGKHLFTALDKLHTNYGAYAGKYVVAKGIAWLAIEVIGAITAFVLGAAVIGGLWSMLLIFNVAAAFLTDSNKISYDNPVRRLERMALEMIADLKKRDQPKEYLRIRSNEVATMLDRVKELQAANEEDGTALQRIFDAMIESRKRSVSQVELQKRIENLTNNPLFVRSAQLSTM